ncbi:MAG: aminotransferase class III-fold pyridoxal phosphate-dependent enzyme, partial [Microcystis panniformis]
MQSNLAAETAALISEMGRVERVAFSNTGTEAIMAAVRIARSRTKRQKIVMFAGSYHGTFDGILARVGEDKTTTQPLSLGTPLGMVEDIIVLSYGVEESLDIIATHADDLAAVLVEPVQSRKPDLQPQEFLQKLRQITHKKGITLIFDEIITGFRIAP